MNKILLAALILVSLQIEAKEITYVGDGRYTCRGSNCEEFNREQKQRNYDQEIRERYRREEHDENQNIENELRRGNEILENQE